jgi:hypothetical protein
MIALCLLFDKSAKRCTPGTKRGTQHCTNTSPWHGSPAARTSLGIALGMPDPCVMQPGSAPAHGAVHLRCATAQAPSASGLDPCCLQLRRLAPCAASKMAAACCVAATNLGLLCVLVASATSRSKLRMCQFGDKETDVSVRGQRNGGPSAGVRWAVWCSNRTSGLRFISESSRTRVWCATDMCTQCGGVRHCQVYNTSCSSGNLTFRQHQPTSCTSTMTTTVHTLILEHLPLYSSTQRAWRLAHARHTWATDC